MRTSDARPPYQVECSMPNAKGNTSIQSPLHPNYHYVYNLCVFD